MNVFYVFGKGKILVKEKCIVLEKYENNRKFSTKIPIENLDILFCNGLIGFSPLSLHKIFRKKVMTVFVDDYKGVKGIIVPIERIFSTFHVLQYKAYIYRRLEIAKMIVESLKASAIFSFNVLQEEEYKNKVESVEIVGESIQEIMGVESKIWRIIYSYLKSGEIDFEERAYNPPIGKMNALISYGNAMLYSHITLKLLKHKFNTMIGFLHELSEGRNSLTLDISESFKLIFILLLDLKLLKDRIINESHFEDRGNSTYLNMVGKIVYTNYFERFLRTKFIKTKEGRKVSIDWMIESEIKNLKRAIEGKEKFSSVWWKVCLPY